MGTIGNKIYVDTAYGFPNNGIIKIDDEFIGYQDIDRDNHILYNITRGVNGTPVVAHFPNSKIYIDLPGAIVLETGRDYIDPPVITAYIDTAIYPEPTRAAHLEPIMTNGRVTGVQVVDPGAGYTTQPEIIIQPSKTIIFNATDVNQIENTVNLGSIIFVTGDSVQFVNGTNGKIKGLDNGKYYYVRVVKQDDPLEVLNLTSQIAFYESKINAMNDNHKIDLTTVGNSTSHVLQLTARIIAFGNNSPVRELTTKIKFDRTSYRSVITDWKASVFYFSQFTPSGFESSLGDNLSKATKIASDISGTTSAHNGDLARFIVYGYVYENIYGIELQFSGRGYSVNNKITIQGTVLNGTTPANDLVINVDTTDGSGRITAASVFSGTPYVSPANEFKNRASMQGARIDITSVDNSQENTKVEVTFADTNVVSAQLKGLRVYFYKNPISYIWEDIITSGSFVIGKNYTIRTVGNTDYTLLGASNNSIGTAFTATGTGLVESGNFVIGKRYIITYIGKTNFKLIGAANNTIGTAFTATGIGTGDGLAKQGTGTAKRTGSATIEFYKPNFGSDRLTNEYFINIIDPGTIYHTDDQIRVKGSLLGGVDGTNDALLKIVYAPKANVSDPGGGISIYELTGIAPKMFDRYYVNPISDTEFNIFYDAPMVRPVKSVNMIYTNTDWVYLPEPVIITTGYTRSPASLVRFNNKVYRCLTSNSDSTFDFDKWEEVLSHDDELNALDRIIGYYQPTANMPGRNLPMLVSGIEYSNNTYYGTKFNETTPIETKVAALPFYPADINIKGITHSGSEYLAVADTKTHTILMSSDDGVTWGYKNISNKHLGVTDIYYSETYYVATTTNKKSPLVISHDGLSWLTAGIFVPFDSNRGFDGDTFDDSSVSVPDSSLYSVVFHNNVYIAVGDRIVSSANGNSWQEIYNFNTKLENLLKSIKYITLSSFQGYIAVGGGYVVTTIGESEPGVEIPTQEHLVGRIFTSSTGFDWQEQKPYLCQSSFNIVFASDDRIIIAGDNGVIFYTDNGLNWSPANIVDDSYTNNILGGIFANSTYVLVGESGSILISYDGISWSHTESNTTQNLNSITYNEDHFIITGNNAVILRSYDGIIWEDVSFVKTPHAFFEIHGDKFTAGYGPEELIAGNVADHLSISVITKPGATWPQDLIPFTGFNISVIESLLANKPISFASAAENPVQLKVFVFDRVKETGIRIYENITPTVTNPYTYTIDWINKTVTFNTNVEITEKVYIEVYEIGGGNHLVRSTSQNIPIRIDSVTGNSEILLGYKYEAEFYTTPIVYRNGSPLRYSIDYDVVTHSDKQAKILFKAVYDPKIDFLSFAVLGNTRVNYVEYSITEQYGYSLPITEMFAYTASNVFTVNGPVSYTNNVNAIVEYNGYRLTKNVDYTLTVNPTSLIGTLTILFGMNADDLISVTTFNDTRQQSLVTEVKNLRINGIESIDFSFAVPVLVVRKQPSFVDGDLVRIDGIKGTTQLNDNAYYASVSSGFTKPEIQTLVYAGTNVFDLLYSQIQDFGTTTVQKNASTIPTADWDLTPNPTDPLKATLTINATLVNGDIITVSTTDGITYYSVVLYNDTLLTSPVRSQGVLSGYLGGGYIWKDSDTIEISQPGNFDLTNNQRLYVSVNRQRIHPNLLRLGAGNKLSILKELSDTDDILITSMIGNASPNGMIFNIDIDKNGQPTVYRSNGANRTWLVKPLQFLDNTIYVDDVSALIDMATLNSEVIEIDTDVLGVWLDYDIAAIKQVSVFNVTSLSALSSSDHILLSKNSRIYVKFKNGVDVGDQVTVSIRLGDTIYVGSEKVRFKSVNYQNNTILGITRGIDGTGTKRVHDTYVTVSGLTPRNILPTYYYDKSWNSENFRGNGDLLQISDFYPARFLRVGTK
jgi:hypothetical protein